MKVMFQFQYPGARPTLEMVREKFGFHADEVDQSYGVALIEPADSTYVIRVESTAHARLSGQASGAAVFGADVPVEPFGRPKSRA
jgi:hypothetical protein